MTSSWLNYLEKCCTCGLGCTRFRKYILLWFSAEEDVGYKDIDLPVSKGRTVTDKYGLLLFFLLLIGIAIVFVRVLHLSRSEIATNRVDALGNVCGSDVGMGTVNTLQHDLLLMSDFLRDPLRLLNTEEPTTYPICVSRCPTITTQFSCHDYVRQFAATYPTDVTERMCWGRKPQLNITFVIKKSICLPETVDSTTPVNRRNLMKTFFTDHWIRNFLSDATTCAREATWMAMIALVMTMMYVLGINASADAICWFTIFMYFTAGTISMATMWMTYVFLIRPADRSSDVIHTSSGGNVTHVYRLSTAKDHGFSLDFLYASIAASVAVVTFAAFTSCAFVTTRRNLNIAALLFYEAAVSLTFVRWIYLLPIISFFCTGIIGALWLLTLSCMTAVYHSEPEVYRDPPTGLNKTVYKLDSTYSTVLLFLELPIGLWLFNIVLSCQHLVVTMVVCTWYFTIGKQRLQTPLMVANSRLWRDHFGSVVVGAFFNSFLFLGELLSVVIPLIPISNEEEKKQLKTFKDVHPLRDEFVNNSCEKIAPMTLTPFVSKAIRRACFLGESSADCMFRHEPNDDFCAKNCFRVSDFNLNGETVPYQEGSNLSKGQLSNVDTLHFRYTMQKKALKKRRFSLEATKRSIFPPFQYLLDNCFVYNYGFGMVALRSHDFIHGGRLIAQMLHKPNFQHLRGLCRSTWYILLMEKLTVLISTLAISFLMLMDKEGVCNYLNPLILNATISIIVSHTFLSLFTASIRAIYVCYLMDKDIQNGSIAAPYFGRSQFFRALDAVLHGTEDSSYNYFHYDDIYNLGSNDADWDDVTFLGGDSSFPSTMMNSFSVVGVQTKATVHFHRDKLTTFLADDISRYEKKRIRNEESAAKSDKSSLYNFAQRMKASAPSSSDVMKAAVHEEIVVKITVQHRVSTFSSSSALHPSASSIYVEGEANGLKVEDIKYRVKEEVDEPPIIRSTQSINLHVLFENADFGTSDNDDDHDDQ